MNSDDIKTLNLSNRIIFALQRYGIYTISRLKSEINRNQLKNIRGIGVESKSQILKALEINTDEFDSNSRYIKVICVQNFGKSFQDNYSIYKLIKCNFISKTKNIPFYIEIDNEGNYTLFATTLLPIDKNSVFAKVKELVNLGE